jgi:hypothetical protein
MPVEAIQVNKTGRDRERDRYRQYMTLTSTR